MKSTNPKMYFIPGGPWISGSYWDAFLANFKTSSPCKRIVLQNHENEYSLKKSSHLIDFIFSLISEIKEESILAGHSYGAWISLLMLNDLTSKKIKKLVLCNMPTSNEQSKEVSSFVKSLGEIDLSTNEKFKFYFQNLLPLYFSDSKNMNKYRDLLTKEIFMEGNEGMLITNQLFNQAMENLVKYQHKIHFIFAEDDLITGKDWMKNNYKNVIIIPKSGHFPMLEQPETFSKAFLSCLV